MRDRHSIFGDGKCSVEVAGNRTEISWENSSYNGTLLQDALRAAPAPGALAFPCRNVRTGGGTRPSLNAHGGRIINGRKVTLTAVTTSRRLPLHAGLTTTFNPGGAGRITLYGRWPAADGKISSGRFTAITDTSVSIGLPGQPNGTLDTSSYCGLGRMAFASGGRAADGKAIGSTSPTLTYDAAIYIRPHANCT